MSDAVRNTNTLNDTPSGERVHIGFFGIRNAGKSSVVNAVTNQELALVSDVRGTTTDPVLKAMELLPIGPVVIIDTPGIDDEGALGALRVERTRQALRQTDVAVLVADSTVGLQEADRELLDLFEEKQKPYVIAFNKTDLLPGGPASYPTDLLPKGATVLPVSAKTGDGIETLKEHLGKLAGTKKEKFILKDLVEPGDFVVLVIPIDASAPKGRIILPQQQVLRELLDLHHRLPGVQERHEGHALGHSGHVVLHPLRAVQGRPRTAGPRRGGHAGAAARRPGAHLGRRWTSPRAASSRRTSRRTGSSSTAAAACSTRPP